MGRKPAFNVITKPKQRIYAGTAKPSVCQMTKTPASLYTHYIDAIPGSPTFGQRLEIPRG